METLKLSVREIPVFSLEEMALANLAKSVIHHYTDKDFVKVMVDQELGEYCFHKWGLGSTVTGRMVRLEFSDQWKEGGEHQYIWTPSGILYITCWEDGGYMCKQPSHTGVRMSWEEFVDFIAACEVHAKAKLWDDLHKDCGAGI